MRIYSSENCQQCAFLKKWLADKGFKFEEVTDESVLESMGIQTIPQLQLDDGRMLSFREALAGNWIEEAV